MFEWIVIIASAVLMYKIADMENLTPLFWFAVTFLLCIICGILLPLPFLRVLLGLILSFVAMTVYNVKFAGPK